MWFRAALLTLAVSLTSSASFAEAVRCGSFPLPDDDNATKEQRIMKLQARGIACIREGKVMQSITTYSEIIGLDPGNTDAYLNRGSAYIQARQFELGLADYSHIIQIKPTVIEAWYNRGTAFVAARQFDAGIADLTEVIRQKPDYERAYCNRGMAYSEKSEYEKALQDLNTGIEKGSVPLCYFVRGELYFRKADYARAVEDFTEGLRLKPEYPQALVQRGRSYEQLGQREKALADFEAALSNAPRFIDAQEGIKRLRGEQGNPKVEP